MEEVGQVAQTEGSWLADSVAQTLAKALPLTRLQRVDAQARAEERRLLVDLGGHALALPETLGGAGAGITEEVAVHREFGRHLVDVGITAVALAAHAAAAGDDTESLASLLAGELAVAVALPDAGAATLRLVGDAEPQCVVRIDDDGAALIELEMTPEVIPCIDRTCSMGRIAEDGVRVRMQVEDAGRLARRARLLFSAQLCGIAAAATELATHHAMIREQFGSPIGAFQAIKHHCADMLLAEESAWSLTRAAADAFAGGTDATDFLVHAAVVRASTAAIDNGRAAIQIHGGMGFSDECPAHLLLKRAHVLSRCHGGVDASLDHLQELPAPWI